LVLCIGAFAEDVKILTRRFHDRDGTHVQVGDTDAVFDFEFQNRTNYFFLDSGIFNGSPVFIELRS